MSDDDIMVVTYPRGTTTAQVHRDLTDHAEYGRWELARVVRYEVDDLELRFIDRPVAVAGDKVDAVLHPLERCARPNNAAIHV